MPVNWFGWQIDGKATFPAQERIMELGPFSIGLAVTDIEASYVPVSFTSSLVCVEFLPV